MPIPGIITGGRFFEMFQDGDTIRSVRRTSLGVFGPNPGSTAKTAFNSNTGGRGRDAEYRESMARLYVEIPQNQMEAFLASVSPRTLPLATVLASGTGTGGATGTGFIDFLLTNTQERFAEKYQIVDTLTDNYVVYFSGREPTVCNYSGVLLNTYQDDQRVWMLRLYNEILRGTRLATRNLIARLRYDSFIVSGYLTDLVLGLDGNTDHTASQFSFSFIAKRLQVITPILGAPTIVQTATSDVVFQTTENLAKYNERTGVVTPDTPPTATQNPAAASTNLAASLSIRQQLRAKGRTDTQINEVMTNAASVSTPAEIDPREEQAVQRQQGTERVYESVQGTRPTLTNPQNVTQDAAGGRTNIWGETSSEPTPLTQRRAGRTRGRSAA